MMYSDRVLQKKFLLLVGDVFVFFLSLILAISLRQQHIATQDQFFGHLPLFLPLFVVSIIIFFLFDLYNLYVLKSISRLLYSLIFAFTINAFFAGSFLYVFSIFSPYSPRTVLLLFFLLSFLLVLVLRFMFWELFFSGFKFVRKILIVGNAEAEPNIRKIIEGNYGVDYRIIGFVGADKNVTTSPYKGIRFLGFVQQLPEITTEKDIEEIVVGFDYRGNPKTVKALSESVSLGIRIYEWPVFYEQIFQKIPANHIDHFWFIGNIDETEKRFYERLKRFADIIVSFGGIVFLAFVFPILFVGIKVTSSGPIFFRQNRIGLFGKTFQLIKFRTMYQDAEAFGARWTVKNDKRVTPFGMFLRRTRLDELPQFINILKGEMSLVGPRPERPEFIDELEEKIPFYSRRNMVLPGITGFAQVMYPYASCVEDSLHKVGYDLYYIKHRSLFLYFKILLRTLKVVILMKGR